MIFYYFFDVTYLFHSSVKNNSQHRTVSCTVYTIIASYNAFKAYNTCVFFINVYAFTRTLNQTQTGFLT